MVDSISNNEQDAVASAAAGSSGFLSTTMGRIILGAGALLVIGAAIAAILLLFVFNQDGAPPVPVVTGTEAPASSSTDLVAAPTERPVDGWEDTYAFRNIFQPTSKITLSPEPTTDGSSTDASSTTDTDIPQDTLYLKSVTTVDGTQVANLYWNGVVYALAEGDVISGTPWEVVSISGDSVVMLYGDSRITLGVGQGLSTK